MLIYSIECGYHIIYSTECDYLIIYSIECAGIALVEYQVLSIERNLHVMRRSYLCRLFLDSFSFHCCHLISFWLKDENQNVSNPISISSIDLLGFC